MVSLTVTRDEESAAEMRAETFAPITFAPRGQSIHTYK